ncbi:hypothetical protein LB507_000879 [Fusarium sp. FIESC RH6]|nr:hypothetical protein LB507_000879 [Fusarium sp. FIESC RH6]
MSFPSCPMLLSSFLMSSVIYWNAYFIVAYILRQRVPDIYRRLNEDELRKLCPLILFTLRVGFGLAISFPSCGIAAATTPWGVNQPLNPFGQVCVVSQVAIWANELSLIRFYSLELFVHHILCLVAASNIILSPSVHQIKPLYIYFASLVGDVGPVSVSVLRLLGYRLSTHKPMYWTSLASTLLLIFVRIGCALYTLTQVMTDPYNLTDWVWVIAVLVFGSYSIYTAIVNLKRLGIIKVDPTRYKVTYFNLFEVPIANMYMALACSISLLSTLFLYGIYLDRPLRTGETHLISLHALVAVVIGLTIAMGARWGLPYTACPANPWGDLYVPFGVLAAVHYAKYISRQTYVDHNTVLGSMGISVPLFFVFSGMAQYYTAKDAAATREEKKLADVNYAKIHLQSATKHAAIFVITLGVSSLRGMDVLDTARLASCASVMGQLRTPWPFDESPLTLDIWRPLDSLVSFIKSDFSLANVTAWYIGFKSRSFAEAIQARLILAMTFTAATLISRKAVSSKSDKAASTPSKSRGSNLITLLYVIFGTLQAMLVWKYITYEDSTSEVSVGFKNFRCILSDPRTWVGLVHMAALPIAILQGAT